MNTTVSEHNKIASQKCIGYGRNESYIESILESGAKIYTGIMSHTDENGMISFSTKEYGIQKPHIPTPC